jgi:GT2 family glycosyltransferase
LALKGLESEIIVVDNDSQDETASLVSKYFPDVKFIQNSSNVGFSKANNQAIKQAKGEYICLINPDTVIAKDVIKKAITKHKTIQKCGILGVRLVDGTGHFLPESKINQLTLRTATLKLLGFSKSYYNNTLNEFEEGKTATLVGAFMCLRSEDYSKVEGLDENYFMYGEDIDLSFQFINAGFQNYYLGQQSILHFKGESTLKDKIYFQRFFDSVKLYFRKHYTNSKIMIGVASVFFVLAKYFKKNQIQKGERLKSAYKKIILVSQEPDLLRTISSFYEKEVISLDYFGASQEDLKDSLVIFNTDQGHYREIINLMSKNKDNNNIFRIKVPNLNILIGSDSSTSQGEKSHLLSEM